MTEQHQDLLWRNCPKTAIAFEQRFATEADGRAYWIEARWGCEPACAACRSKRVWPERSGTLFEHSDSGHQTSLTTGTLLEGTRKARKVWFQAIFEIAACRHGISAINLQLIMGFGSSRTAWTWLHKLLAARSPEDRDPFGPCVQVDETLVGGKGGPYKELVLVAVEQSRRVRLAHADNNGAGTLKCFCDGHFAVNTHVVSGGHSGYNATSLGMREREALVQTKAEWRRANAVQVCHRTASLMKRWVLGTHGGAVGNRNLQPYLDELAFRQYRRRTNGVVRIAARVIEHLVSYPPLKPDDLIASAQRSP